MKQKQAATLPKTFHTSAFFDLEWKRKLALVDTGIEQVIQLLRTETKPEENAIALALDSYISLLSRGGKRLRGVLTVTGFELFHSKKEEDKNIAFVSGIIECFHAYLLVMDDIADDASLRRGGLAAHLMVEQRLGEQGLAGGDIRKISIDTIQAAVIFVQHALQSYLVELPVAPDHALRLLGCANRHLAQTGIGQTLDILSSAWGEGETKKALQVAIYKTSFYTFLMPLQMGAILAGASDEEMTFLFNFSMHAGLAFQLRDDVISLFADDLVSGKSSMSDIVEAKQTFIMGEALRQATSSDRATLRDSLGNKQLPKEKFSTCLQILEQSGALEATTKLIAYHCERALASLDDAPTTLNDKQLTFLREVALYGANREL